MKQTWLITRALFSRRWLGPTFLALMGMLFLARLGLWQLDRLAERRAANAQLLAVLEGPPLELTGESNLVEMDGLPDRKVTVVGTYDFEAQGKLILQNWQGRSGVHLVTPLRIAGSERAVLVDRGWIPDSETADLDRFNEPGQVTVHGYIAASQTLSRQGANDAQTNRADNEWYRIDVAAIQSQLPYELYSFYVVATSSEENNDELPYRRPQQIDLSEGAHLSYAIQWFIFSALLGLMYGLYINKQLS